MSAVNGQGRRTTKDRAKRTRVTTKVVQAIGIQVAIVSLAGLLGIWLTSSIVYGIAMRQTLNDEAEHFWSRYAEDPSHPPPDVANLRGYLAQGGDFSAVPESLRSLPPAGFSEQQFERNQALVHVSERDGVRLFLVFAREQVSEIAVIFGIVPLAIVLVIVYGLSYLTYLLSKRALSPLVRLARQLEEFDFENNRSFAMELSPLREVADQEVVTMIDAVEQFSERLATFVERERVFTRDAGHELRTPLAVFKGSLDLLERNQDRPAFEKKALLRMRRTVNGMESLLETLLLLAREDVLQMPTEATSVNAVVAGQLELLQPLADEAVNRLALHEEAELEVRAPGKVVEIVVGNLIRNAINYTRQGSVEVTITRYSVRVVDTGIGMSAEELDQAFEPFYRADESRGVTKGHGLGLAIVKRLVHQFGWTISAHSTPDEGTGIEVRFQRPGASAGGVAGQPA